MEVETLRESIAEANRFIAAAKRVEIKEITGTHSFEGKKYLKGVGIHKGKRRLQAGLNGFVQSAGKIKERELRRENDK